ncbi:MAG: response regulator [Sulfurimonas sp.]|uniref:response regulator n=1 Tax=Sulfurimonas sp. TaxID=2022749 RepID=UPI0025D55CBB|nr:response regulator [Sulfurimonas sp.]MCK9492650.1 response regulator [Sulfurimonas sp.]
MGYEFTDINSNILEHLKSLTLLCVEENPQAQQLYRELFECYLEEIIFSDNALDGYNKYISNNIDIILCSCVSSEKNALELINKIRVTNKDIPVIFVLNEPNVATIQKILKLKVTEILEKPIDTQDALNALEGASKIVIANKFLQDSSKMQKLEAREKYSSIQQELAFAKELNILRNDFYYQAIDNENTILVDFSYQPLDTLSGDSYSARKIDENKAFYLIVDGMGSGLSASLSSMLMTSFINHTIDKMLGLGNFELDRLIYDSLEYIKPILLEDEMLSVDFILLDCIDAQMHYAKFSMPSMLLQNRQKEILKVKSNNPPISKYIKQFKTSSYDVSNIYKFLFYSDGMIENSTRFKDKVYMEFIEEDFYESFTKEGMKQRLLWKIEKPEDDITFIYINRLDLKDTVISKRSFNTTLDAIDEANEYYTNLWESLTDDAKLVYKAGIVFSELFMNAYEHGNLSIDTQEKHTLIEEDKYLDTLIQLQENCTKKINVTISKVEYNSYNYIITKIEDEGDGFDTQILSKIFRNVKSFNGRGVFVSRSSSLGIYYNAKGNSVLFLHKT